MKDEWWKITALQHSLASAANVAWQLSHLIFGPVWLELEPGVDEQHLDEVADLGDERQLRWDERIGDE